MAAVLTNVSMTVKAVISTRVDVIKALRWETTENHAPVSSMYAHSQLSDKRNVEFSTLTWFFGGQILRSRSC